MYLLGCFSRSVPDLVFRCAIGRGQSTVRRVAERGNQANAQFLAARIDLIGHFLSAGFFQRHFNALAAKLFQFVAGKPHTVGTRIGRASIAP